MGIATTHTKYKAVFYLPHSCTAFSSTGCEESFLAHRDRHGLRWIQAADASAPSQNMHFGEFAIDHFASGVYHTYVVYSTQSAV